MLKKGVALLFPSLCCDCTTFISRHDVFCKTCKAGIKPVDPYPLSLPSGHTLTVHAISPYSDPLRSLILRKNSADRLASRQLACLMSDMISSQNLPIDYLIPIPLHWTRYAKRGFNQSHEMATVLSKKLNIPLLPILKRTRRTKFQSRLSHEKRQKNVTGVFVIHPSYQGCYQTLLYKKTIAFVDDLYTTGATLKNAAQPLLGAQLRGVRAVVACRVV